MSFTTILDIEVTFKFSRDGSDPHEVQESFDCVDSSLQTVIDDRAEELAEELNDDLDDDERDAAEWEFDEYEVDDFDGDFADPADFSDLDDYGEYCEKVSNHGVAYHLRYEDVGDHDFEDEYNGEWDSAEDFVRNLVEDCYDLDIPSFVAVDWEQTARDVMMDYSEYEDDNGMVHIFRS